MTTDERLDRIESLLSALVERKTIKDFYEIEEFARLIGKSAFTVREWARYQPNPRDQAEKRAWPAQAMGDQPR